MTTRYTAHRLRAARLATAFSLGAVLLTAMPATAAPASAAIVVREFVYTDAPYPQSHASTIVETTAGTIAASWFGGTHERNPDVGIWFARRVDGKWREAIEVANGLQADGTRQPTWNPVLFQPPGGDLHLFYKVGPSPQAWWGMVTTSADDGRTWSKPRRLPEGILGPIKNKPVVLPDGAWLSPVSVELREGVTLADGGGWDLYFERSEDQGRTWTKTPLVASPLKIDAIQSSILFHPGGVLEAVARTRQGALAQTWSRDNGKTWSPLATIDLPNPNSGTDAVTLADGRQLLVYNHTGHLPATPGKGLRYPLNVAISNDGITWREVATLESEPRPDGYAYPAVIQAKSGQVHITYTFNRRGIRHVVLDPAKLP
ncbi:MAG: sialidase family protein [Caulobacter sp.]